MYLLEYNEQGKIYKITPSPSWGLVGVYVNDIPVSIATMLEEQTVEQITEDNKIKYIIKGEN